jgi:hypothetical protein
MAAAFDVTSISGGVASAGPVRDVASRPIGANSIVDSERYRTLDYRQQYGDAAQHDWKLFDFDGRAINAGPRQQQPFLAETASFYVPLKVRRPCAPVHLGKTIVNAFTNLLFGEERFPKVMVGGDEDSQDFKQALAKSAKLRTRFLQARQLGGSMGTVALTWCYRNGRPRVQVRNAKNLWVHSWQDRDELIPEWMSEIYRYYKDVYDFSEYKYRREWYWYRRDWTPEAEVVWDPIPYRQNREPEWLAHVNQSRSIVHGDGKSHVVWIQNVPTDGIDGLPDYEGLYDPCDTLDVLNSVLARGTTLNLDPTLVLKLDQDVQRFIGGVKKGSDNSLSVGLEGSAEYLELAGSSVEAGAKLFELMKRTILEQAQCVIPNPDEIAASGTSSVAMKVIYRPMLAQAAILREQYGEAIDRILEDMTQVAKAKMATKVPILDDKGQKQGDAVPMVDLPPRVTQETVLDADGNPTDEKRNKTTPRAPGEGGETTLDWGEWFPLTPQDKALMATTISTANGAQPFLSKQSAVEEGAAVFGRDSAEEWKRAAADAQQAKDDAQDKMDIFADKAGAAGGKVGAMNQLPPGAKPKKPNPFAAGTPKPKPSGGQDDDEDPDQQK